jgi:undecaprenyl-diphosphatase
MARLKEKTINFISAVSQGLILSLFLGLLKTQSSLAYSVPQITEGQAEPTTKFNVLQAAILGIVQGLTEFLPISSTAHLKVVPVVLGWGDPGVTFTAVIQLGSIAAVLWYFWGDLSNLGKGVIAAIGQSDYKSQSLRMAMGIILGTIPIVFFGLLLKLFVKDLDNSPLRSMTAIAIASIIMALLLALAEDLGRHKRDFEHLQTKDGILMGLAQALALIPGVSRSGSTLTAGLFIGLDRATAARFSFLLGLPAITLAGLVELKDVLDANISGNEIIPLIVGTISSAIFSYLAIAWLLRYLQKQNTWVFIWYRLGFGLIILAGVVIHRF